MSEDWRKQFHDLFFKGVERQKEGRQDPESMFEGDEPAFLESIGCSTQEMFDFCDDYVRWGDVIFNIAGRPKLGWKTLWIVIITVLITLNGKYDWVTWLMMNEGIEKDTLSLLTIGMTYLIGVRINLSYDRYYEARKCWGMVVNRTRDIVRMFYAYCDDKALCADTSRSPRRKVHVSTHARHTCCQWSLAATKGACQ